MNEEPLDLRRIARVLKKAWLVLLIVFWAGTVAGYLFGSRESTYVARSSVLLPPSAVDARGKEVRNIATEVNIAGNGNILERAGRVVNPPLGVQTMRKQVRVTALTADIIEVRAQARSPRDAALLADAVANEYVGEATDASSKIATVSTSALQAEAAKLEKRLSELSSDIEGRTADLNGLPAGSPERPRQAALIDSQRLEETDTARQLASLNRRVADAQLVDRLNRQGTRLLAPATAPLRPSGPPLLASTVGGGLLGMLVGAFIVLARDRRDGRLRRRSEIAAVVAAPILASLEAPRRTTARRCQAMLEEWKPRPVVSFTIRRAFLHLGIGVDEPPCNVVVVGLPGDGAAPLLALQVAVVGASAGLRTALVVGTSHPTAAALRSACHASLGGSKIRPGLTALSGDLARQEACDEIRQAQLVVTFVIGGSGPLEAVPLGVRTMTTLAVSSGRATADTLASTALACLDAGRPVAGVFLANPDPSDQTNGGPVPRVAGRPGVILEGPALSGPGVEGPGADASEEGRGPEVGERAALGGGNPDHSGHDRNGNGEARRSPQADPT